MKLLINYPTRTEAELLASQLTANGIKTLVTADDVGGLYPTNTMGGAKVFVSEKDFQQAKTIIEPS